MFGFRVFRNFYQVMEKTGVVLMPGRSRFSGSHAVMAVGYDNSQHCFIIQNSWGAKWGPMGGYFMMPYNYLLMETAANDFWTIRLVI